MQQGENREEILCKICFELEHTISLQGDSSRRRGFCHSAAPPSTFVRRFNRDKKGGAIKMTASPTARRLHHDRGGNRVRDVHH